MRGQESNLTFLDKSLDLCNKKVFDKVEKYLLSFKENGEEGEEDCLEIFFMDINGAKSRFLNKLRDLPMIMKCRTKIDNDSKFGGQQCAEFMKDIQLACDNYLNSSIYSQDNSEFSLSDAIKRVRDMAELSEKKAWNFENKARLEYLNTGEDITLEILKKTGYNI